MKVSSAVRAVCWALAIAWTLPGSIHAQLRLADASDRAAFRSWFVLLADAQFERPAAEVTDCAALVRYAFREALRAHTPEWARRVTLPFAPTFPDVQSAPKPSANGWALFRISATGPPRYAELPTPRPSCDSTRNSSAAMLVHYNRAICSIFYSQNKRSRIT
jgi:hypothetical protein